MKLIEHAMKIIERVLERRMQTLVNLNKMQFAFMPGKETVNAIFIVGRMQEKYQKKDNVTNKEICLVRIVFIHA